MAHEYQLAKYYAGDGENWGANGGWETSRGEDGCSESPPIEMGEAYSKPAPLKI
jgi:hypothetical protein